MNWKWTWSGRCFGYWDGYDLWARSGRHVGRRHGQEIYAADGRYLGELMDNGRLARNQAKASLMGPAFVRLAPKSPPLSPPNVDGLPLYAGFEDFRELERL